MGRIATIGGLPVYECLLEGEDTGMFRVSLVDEPAVLSDFQTFKKDEKPVTFRIEDEEKRLVFGVVMRADFPIYRRNEDGFEYYLIFHGSTIRKMAEQYLREGRQNQVNLMHVDGSEVEGVEMVQMFLKDSSKGVSPEGFDLIADGSLFAEYHVTNDEVWASIKEGTYRGFSLEGVFDCEPEQNVEYVEKAVEKTDGVFEKILKRFNINNMNLAEKVKAKLRKVLGEFGKLTTDKGILSWEGEEDIAEGAEVMIVTEEGETIAPEDGEYTTEDKVIVIKEGKVVEIREKEVAEEPVAEEQVEAEEETDAEGIEGLRKEMNEMFAKHDERISAVDKEINELYKLVDSIADKIGATRDELDALKQTPSATPAHKEIKKEFAIEGSSLIARIAKMK